MGAWQHLSVTALRAVCVPEEARTERLHVTALTVLAASFLRVASADWVGLKERRTSHARLGIVVQTGGRTSFNAIPQLAHIPWLFRAQLILLRSSALRPRCSSSMMGAHSYLALMNWGPKSWPAGW